MACFLFFFTFDTQDLEYQYDTLYSDIYPGKRIRTRLVFQVADISSDYLLVFNTLMILTPLIPNKPDIGYDMNNIIISLGSEPITLDPPDDFFFTRYYSI